VIEVVEGGVVGALCEPDGNVASAAVVLTGSGGGIPIGYAARLAKYGIRALALAYFRAPGLPSRLVEVPVEIVERGVAWLAERSAGLKIGLVGTSRGAELALLAAGLLPQSVGATVAIAPSGFAWYGLDDDDPDALKRPAWTWRGRHVPFLHYAAVATPIDTADGVRLDGCYDVSHYTQAELRAATICIEEATGPLLLLSGNDDHVWPSASFAERIAARMVQHGRGHEVDNVVYRGAGHAFLHREFAPSSVLSRFDWGGDDEADQAAAADAWPRIADFLGGRPVTRS